MIKQSNHITSLSRQLRKNMTKEEKHLWYDFLSEYPVRFKKQRPFEIYIVDFYCAKAKLAVEIDGSQHYKPEEKEYDRVRTLFLQKKNIKVMRFTNKQVNEQFAGVCFAIDRVVKQRLQMVGTGEK